MGFVKQKQKLWGRRDSNPHGLPHMILSPSYEAKLLNKMTVSELAELSGLSKSYISQVKNGKCPSSQKLLDAISQKCKPSKPVVDYVGLFIKSRGEGLSIHTIEFYRLTLNKAVHITTPKAKPSQVNSYLRAVPGNGGNKHAHFRALRAFFHWLYSPKSGMKLNPQENPMLYVDAPKVPKLILPSLTTDEVERLISEADSTRDKAIIALFTESGLRLSELACVKLLDIDWDSHVMRVLGKEGYAPFGTMSERYLKAWLEEYKPKLSDSIWGLKPSGIEHMLQTLNQKTGLPCNPHTFRRTFACLLRKAGVDTMTIKDLGKWESLGMVQRYTRSVTFYDSLKLYKAPLS